MTKKITLENLAEKIDKGFKKADKKIDEKIDKLALAVAKGFEGVDERFDENTKEHQEIFKLLNKHTNKLDNLERGQEGIELRLSQVAFRFEIQDLGKRLKRVEAKVG